jgi:hypothetical protein
MIMNSKKNIVTIIIFHLGIFNLLSCNVVFPRKCADTPSHIIKIDTAALQKCLQGLSNSSIKYYVDRPRKAYYKDSLIIYSRIVASSCSDEAGFYAPLLFDRTTLLEIYSWLNDTIRDWAANILLYACHETNVVDGLSDFVYLKEPWKPWRVTQKERDMERWKGRLGLN